ncbi:two-component system regulatory protein YycI [Petroclostridium sp. X23]|uniref:two-component system regulatory protein YycI n=1 Tax=Petroclostridium sp. X23 TaxID=3045146 RepID=UPI0024ADD478|nr:two-component system regulatory protein YycI [Petroclostridium sp. X23]WHH57404.1 two-component system regulatory protein YycI [Petroclostridium sp. X23]
MYWSRVKTILIILFLCINIILLVNMMVSVNQTITISADVVEDTVEVLKRNGIGIDPSIIPTKMRNMPSLEIENPVQHPSELAETMFGAGFEQQEEENKYKFVLNNKILEVHGCEFIYTDPEPDMDMIDLNDANAVSYAKEALEEFKFDLKYASPGIVRKINDDEFAVTFRQKFEKRDVFSNHITVILSSKGVTNIKGYWLLPKRFTSEKLPVYHITGILIDFIKNPDRPQDQNSTITGITLGYYRVDTNKVYIKNTTGKPVWRISTGDGKSYYYDGATGNYMGMEN